MTRSDGDPPGRVHLLVPSLDDVAVGKGGTCMYRGLALAAAALAPTTCYQTVPAAPGGTGWHPAAPATRRLPVAALLAELAAALRPGDLVVKCTGAAGMDADWRADARVARLAAEHGGRSVYLDPDAPYRLGLLDRHGPLAAALPRYSGALVVGGGPPAVAGYEALAGRGRVGHVPTAVSALPVEPATDFGAPRDVDVFVPVAAASAREGPVGRALRRWILAADPPRVAVAGDWPAGPGPAVLPVPLGDPRTLLPTYRRSRYVLNVLRAELTDYSDVAAARVFEAALSGAVVLTQRFAGLERVLEPGVECVVLEDLDDVVRVVRELPERRRREIAGRAAARVLRDRVTAGQALAAALLATPPAAPVPADWERRLLRAHDLWADPSRPIRIGLLPHVSAGFAAELVRRLSAARLTPGPEADFVAVGSEHKDALDDRLRGRDRRPRGLLVEVASARSARSVRWIPGRDWLPPGTDGWPWTTPAGPAPEEGSHAQTRLHVPLEPGRGRPGQRPIPDRAGGPAGVGRAGPRPPGGD